MRRNSTISTICSRAIISASVTSKGLVGSCFTTRVVLKWITPSSSVVNTSTSSRGFLISPAAFSSLYFFCTSFMPFQNTLVSTLPTRKHSVMGWHRPSGRPRWNGQPACAARSASPVQSMK